MLLLLLVSRRVRRERERAGQEEQTQADGENFLLQREKGHAASMREAAASIARQAGAAHAVQVPELSTSRVLAGL